MAWLEFRRGKFFITWRENGRLAPRKATNTSNRAVAQKLLDEFRAVRTLGLDDRFIKKPDRTMTFDEAYQLFLTVRSISPGSKHCYDAASKYWLNANGNLPLFRYTRANYLALLGLYKQKKLADNTAALYNRQLKALFNFFIKEKLYHTQLIERLNPPSREVITIPDHDLTSMIAAAPPRLAFIIEFLVHTGLRAGEAVALKWIDIDQKNQIIKVVNQKARRTETIPIIDALARLLKRHRATSPHARVFGYNTYWPLRDDWNNLMDTLGGKLEQRYTIHQLRKTCGTKLANAGVNPYELQRYMRHSNISVTLKYYIKTDMSKMRDEINTKLKTPPRLPPQKGKLAQKRTK